MWFIMNKKLTIFMALFAAYCGTARAEMPTDIFQICEETMCALERCQGIELCKALESPHAKLRQLLEDIKSDDILARELKRLEGHLELLSESWRLERVQSELTEEELATFWGFSYVKTKELALIQAQLVYAAFNSFNKLNPFSAEQNEDFIQLFCKFIDVFLKRAEFAIQYLKEIERLKVDASEDLRVDVIGEVEFYLAIQDTLQMLKDHASHDDRIDDRIEVLYENRVRAVLQELEGLYVPATKA